MHTVSASDEESIAQYIKDVPRGHFNEANYTQTVTFKLLISGVSVMPPALFVTSNIPKKNIYQYQKNIFNLKKYLLTLIDGLAVLSVALAAHRGHCRALQNACSRGHELIIKMQ